MEDSLVWHYLERISTHGTTALYVLIVALSAVAAHLLILRLGATAKRLLGKVRVWEQALLTAANAPLRALVWLLGTLAIARALANGVAPAWLAALPAVRNTAIILIVTWFLLRFTSEAEAILIARTKEQNQDFDPSAADAVGKLVRIAIVTAAALQTMQVLGLPISGLLAFGGIGGVALGFAAQGLAANFFGGLTVYTSKPFKMGELIIMPEQNVMGEVQEIGWRITRVMGFDRRPIFVPNSLFNTAVLINNSRMTHRRIMEHLNVRYEDVDKVPAIVAEVNQMLGEHPELDHSFYVFRVDAYGEFALRLLLYAFTIPTAYIEYMRVKEDVLLKVAEIIRRHGAKLAVPATTVSMPEGLRLHRGSSSAEREPLLEGLVAADRLPPQDAPPPGSPPDSE